MYPLLKLTKTLVAAKFRTKLDLEDKSVLTFRASLMDIDIFTELNHARYLNLMELGRWDYSTRIGFISIMKQNKWGIAVGGASIRYRRRIPFLAKFTLSTQFICHDGRWIYFLQETHRNTKICSSALMKVGITSKQGLVPATEVTKAFHRPDFGTEMPDWVNAWIEAEGQRPWPSG